MTDTTQDPIVLAVAKAIDPAAWAHRSPPLYDPPLSEVGAPTWLERLLGRPHGDETKKSARRRAIYLTNWNYRIAAWEAECEALRGRREQAINAARIAVGIALLGGIATADDVARLRAVVEDDGR